MYEVKVYENFNQELISYWKDFEDKNDIYFFQSFEWLKTYIDIFLNKKKNLLKIGIVFKNQEILMIIPMQVTKKFDSLFLEWIGNEVVDFMCPLISKNLTINKTNFDVIWASFLKKIKKYDFILLKKQPEFIKSIQNPFTIFLKKDNKKKYFLIENHKKSWDEYFSSIFNSKHKYNLEISRRKLEKFGKLLFQQTASYDEKIKVINLVIKNKKLQYFKEKNNNLLNFDKLENFYLNLLLLEEKKKNKKFYFQISTLKLNNNIIAGCIGVVEKDSYHYLIPSYDDKFKKYSPGIILLKNIISWSFLNKIVLFNFGDGDEFYKKKWSNKIYFTYDFADYNSIRGFILYSFYKAKIFFR
jgi:CelD/BcsL family acetyltransferase involved in cellulose biosynthesis